MFAAGVVVVMMAAGGELVGGLSRLAAVREPLAHRSAGFLRNVLDMAAIFLLMVLGLRLFLRVLGANPTTPFVELIYGASQPLVAPFWGMFPQQVMDGAGVLEVSTIFAFLVCGGLLMVAGDFLRSTARLAQGSWIRTRALSR